MLWRWNNRRVRKEVKKVAAVLVLVVSACSESTQPSTFAIATGGPAGLYYPYGGGMASIWSKELPHVNAKAEVTGGSVTNVIQVARHESELGIAMADVVTDAYLGTGRFPNALPLRVLFTAYPNIVHILTLRGSGVEKVAELQGKRVSLGAAGSGTAVAAACQRQRKCSSTPALVRPHESRAGFRARSESCRLVRD